MSKLKPILIIFVVSIVGAYVYSQWIGPNLPASLSNGNG